MVAGRAVFILIIAQAQTPLINNSAAGARGREIRNTVIFAALDKEEVGCEGSRAFIRDFIVPVVVTQFGATVQVIDLPLQIKYF